MRAINLCAWLGVLAFCLSGCNHNKTTSPPQQAQAPPLQTGKGTLKNPATAQQQEKTASPLASPLPPTSAQSVPLPPAPPKKVRHRVKATPVKLPETAPNSVAPSPGPSIQVPPVVSPTAQVTPPQQPAVGTASPIGQLTTGDGATGERTKHETSDLIGETQQGLNGIKRSLSTEEKVTAAQIHTFLKQAQQALENGDTDGAHTLATKARLLLDELTKP